MITNMFRDWFLDYASYSILDRSVPHIGDGLKPVQRRILHSMRQLHDGRYNKVANIVGHTMQYHPHGDASIKDALVTLGQKGLLIDCQGNWGNIITGDPAAAGRYIEARLSKLALDVVFNPKTTEWQMSYDGRNQEPISLPVKFPLLLAQGTQGIAVGLSCNILPHNFAALCQAAISYLRGEDFQLFPDFPTGGSIDASNYRDGQRGGSIRVRAKIEKRDAKTLAITEIPYGCTTGTASEESEFVNSIIAASEKGKIKIRKVEDLTAERAEILIHLTPGTSPDKTIDALYATTKCQISISPNCCVIVDHTPEFLTVSDVLRRSTDNTLALLRKERQIRRGELMESLHFASLEEIFIEERIYKDQQFEQAKSTDEACEWIDERLTPFYPNMVREVTKDDILRLLEIKMQRILRFNKDKAEEHIARLQKEVKQIDRELKHMTEVTIEWFQTLLDRYGAEHPRLTEIKNFDNITAATVVEANEKLYINRKENFIGYGLKRDEYVCNCSDIDDVIVFFRDGTYKVVRIQEKLFLGDHKEVIHLAVFKKNDQRTVYNAVYADGRSGISYIKRFTVTSVVRDREYNLTQGTPGTKVSYLSANPNGEAETVKVSLRLALKFKGKMTFEKDFSEVPIKGRNTMGNILTKAPVSRIALKSHGLSTLGGRQVWYDPTVGRINYDGQGELLGEFNPDDRILVILPEGEFYTTSFDANNHYEPNLLRIEKHDTQKIWTAIIDDADQGYAYIKRFTLGEAAPRKQSFLGDNPKNSIMMLTDVASPKIEVTLGGADSFRAPLTIEAEEFALVKGFKARGKRLTTFAIDKVELLDVDTAP